MMMFKKTFTCAIAAAATLCLLAVTAGAETTDADYTSPASAEVIADVVPTNGITESLDGATYTSGDYEYTLSNEEVTVTGYTGSATSVTIPSKIASYPVVAVNGAFNGNTTITSVTIPSGVTKIGDGTFKGCTSLSSVSIPATVITIGDSAFYNCTKLTTVSFPAALTHVNAYAFQKSGIKSLALPESLEFLGHKAFADCTNLVDISFFDTIYTNEDTVLEWGLRYSESYAFSGCTALTTVDFSSYAESIYPFAFNGCTALKTVKLHEGLNAIGASVFKNCSSLTSITLPSTLTSIGDTSFYNCTKLTSVSFPAALTHIYAYAFQESGIKSLALPESLEFLGNHAFADCTNLVDISFFDTIYTNEDTVLEWGLRYSESYAFSGCTALTTVDFSSYAESIYPFAFNGCTALKTVKLHEGLNAIGASVFKNCSSLTSITLPSTLTSIGDTSFYNCTKLTSISLPAALTHVYAYAFQKSGLKSVALPESLELLGHHSFADCTNLVDVDFYETVYTNEDTVLEWELRYSESYAFSGCTALTTVDFSPYAKTIQPYAFNGCTSLKSIKLYDGLTTIYNNAFYNCAKLTDAVLPNTVTSINEYAFQKSGIKDLNLPDSLEYLGHHAFADCPDLTTVNFFNSGYANEDTALSWGLRYSESYAFSGCDALVSVNLSPYVKTIPPYTFNSCDKLKGITFSNNVTNINAHAFANCPILSDIYYVGTSDEWYNILIETDGNTYFNDATVHYNSLYTPILVSATAEDGTVTLKWNAVSGATSYKVYRAPSAIGTKTLLKSVGTTSCTDTTGNADNTYYYFIKAYNSKTGGGSDYSNYKSAYIKPFTLNAPTLSVTQAKGQINISWNAVSGATSYKVYRATAAAGTKTLLKTVSTTSCNDTTATFGNTYYYFVQAYSSTKGVGSAYSGYKSLKFTSLAPPTLNSVTASGNAVNLSWSAVPNATSYRVYRGTSATGAKSLLKTVSTTSCNNTSVTAGTTYYYYVVAYSSKTGTMSAASNTKSVTMTSSLSAPTLSSVTQAKGQINIAWNSVSDATSYKVYRATSATGTKTLLKTVGITSCTDTTATFGTTYYYFVQACSSKTGATSAYSGYKSLKFTSLAPPTLNSVTMDGTAVTLSWSAVPNATSYRVYRGTSATGAKSLLKTVSTTSCNNTSVTAGTTYYYYVVAYSSKTDTMSAASNTKSVTVKSTLAAPTLNSISANGNTVTLGWSAVSGATSYRVYRATSATGTKTLLKTVGITSCNDTTAVAGGTYYYFVAAYNSSTGDLSNYSNYKAVIV